MLSSRPQTKSQALGVGNYLRVHSRSFGVGKESEALRFGNYLRVHSRSLGGGKGIRSFQVWLICFWYLRCRRFELTALSIRMDGNSSSPLSETWRLRCAKRSKKLMKARGSVKPFGLFLGPHIRKVDMCMICITAVRKYPRSCMNSA